ncbi:ABC transporter permease [Desulfovibrionales bacterium]
MPTWLRYFFDLVLVLTAKEIKVRYKSSILGYIWSIALPLSFACAFYIAFKVVMRVKMDNYALFLICGLFPWQWFSNSINAAPMILLGNSSIIKKVRFPRAAVCMAMVLNDGVHFLLSVPVIALFLYGHGMTPAWSWLYGLPLLFLIQFGFTYGLVLIIAAVNLFFRDMERLIAVCMTLLFYFTPIIYAEDMIPQQYQYLIALNPLAPLMVAWRTLFLQGTLPLNYVLSSLVWSVALTVAGGWIFRRLSPRFAEVL